MKKFLISLGALLSTIFLITRRTDVFLGTTTSFHITVAISLILLGTFMYYYFRVFEQALVQQMQSIQQKSANNWLKWFSETLPEWAGILAALIPYLVGILAVTKGVSVWIPAVAFLQSIAFLMVMAVCMFIVFLMTNCLYYKFSTK